MRSMIFGLSLVLVLMSSCDDDPRTDAQRLARMREMAAGYAEEFPEVPQVSVAELTRLRETDAAILVDARPPEEYRVSMIPGAITIADWRETRERYGDRKVVLYCTIGYRSSREAAMLREDGVDAANLEGSILAWAHAGHPLVRPDGELTDRIHVYGEAWNLAPAAYEAVW